MDYELRDKVPPHNMEAEQAVLGAVLLDWKSLEVVRQILKDEDFFSNQNRYIYEAMLSLLKQDFNGDVLTLIDEVRKMDKLEQVGGIPYISSLTELVPSTANVEYYAKIVKDRAVRRNLLKVTGEIKASVFEISCDTSEILGEAEKKIFSLNEKNEKTEMHFMPDVMHKVIKVIDERSKSQNAFTGIPSGYSKLDSMTFGFQKQELIIIGARPAIGKTSFALSMMQNIAVEKKIPCGFFSLEMPYEAIGQRLLSQEAKIPQGKLKSGKLTLSDLRKIQDAAGRIFDSPLCIVDTPNMNLLDLKAMARRMVKDAKIQIVFIDYIGLISVENKQAPVYEQVSEVSKALKSLARELDIPVVALCQVSREAEGQEPGLNMLRGSGSIEQDADIVMFLHRERKVMDEEKAVQDAKLIVAKQRNGMTGDVPLMFLGQYTKFENAVER